MVRKLSVVVLAAAMLLGTVQASQAVLTAMGPTSPATGYFPVWYQDSNALSLELCLSSAPSPDPAAAGAPMCVLLPSPPYFDETLPPVFPVNFPRRRRSGPSPSFSSPSRSGAAWPSTGFSEASSTA